MPLPDDRTAGLSAYDQPDRGGREERESVRVRIGHRVGRFWLWLFVGLVLSSSAAAQAPGGGLSPLAPNPPPSAPAAPARGESAAPPASPPAATPPAPAVAP